MPEADLEAFAALIDQADLSSLRTWACNASFERLRPSALPGRLASCKGKARNLEKDPLTRFMPGPPKDLHHLGTAKGAEKDVRVF